MHWKIKALVQNAVAGLPSGFSYPVYYGLQRVFGRLRTVNPMRHFENCADIIRRFRAQGGGIEGKALLEVGTGRTVNVPLGFWLCGAGRVVTVDLNPYLRGELVIKSVRYLRTRREEIEALFSGIADPAILRERLDRLLSTPERLDAVLALAHIEYRAPADATALDLPHGSVDYHYSSNVFEHVSPEIMRGILREARRVLAPGGLFLHRMDLSDHFSHTDSSISAVNFLRFDEREWGRLSGNRYMYHNRMRAYEYYGLFREEGAVILDADELVDELAADILADGFPLDGRFGGHTPHELAVIYLTITGRFSPREAVSCQTSG